MGRLSYWFLRIEIAFILSLLDWWKILTDEGGEGFQITKRNSQKLTSFNKWHMLKENQNANRGSHSYSNIGGGDDDDEDDDKENDLDHDDNIITIKTSLSYYTLLYTYNKNIFHTGSPKHTLSLIGTNHNWQEKRYCLYLWNVSLTIFCTLYSLFETDVVRIRHFIYSLLVLWCTDCPQLSLLLMYLFIYLSFYLSINLVFIHSLTHSLVHHLFTYLLILVIIYLVSIYAFIHMFACLLVFLSIYLSIR